jgi:(1->4)-alpha-D-glucan 1-alpha-D-glucosylmutase
VPDFYQGTELWDFSMVDPDNRRPVDYASREASLISLEVPDWATLTSHWLDGRIKLAWSRELLKLRGNHPDLFSKGDYIPLEVQGRHRDHVIAFARQNDDACVIVAVCRMLGHFTDGGRTWLNTQNFDAEIDVSPLAGATSVHSFPIADIIKTLPAGVRIM